jgi:hypothetical protein
MATIIGTAPDTPLTRPCHAPRSRSRSSAAFLFLTYYLQTIKAYSPVTAGLAFLPMVGGLLVSANAAGGG